MINKMLYTDNIRTLSANTKFILTSFRNEKKEQFLTTFLSCSETSTSKFYIRVNVRVLCLYCNVMFLRNC